MTRMFSIGLVAALALGLSVTTAGAAKTAGAATCIKAGGTATGMWLDFAKFMSHAAAKNSAKAWGGDGVKLGPVVHKCDNGYPIACSATVKACK